MRRSDWLAAIAITAFALTLRALGARFGLPWFHHWDEGFITDSASNMLHTRDWRPSVYQYGAPLPMLMAMSVRVLSAAFPERVFDPNDGVLMHLLGRGIVIVISASGAFATYAAARFAFVGDRGGRVRAIYAALVYAGAAELVAHGRYAVTDACLAALVAWTLACGAQFARGGTLRWGVATTFFAASAAAFKITAAPAIVIPVVLLFVSRRGSLRRTVALATAMVVFGAVIFFVQNPHVLLHSHEAGGDIFSRIRQYRDGGVPEFVLRNRGFEHLLAVLSAIVLQVFHRNPILSATLALGSFAGLSRAVWMRSPIAIAGATHAFIVVVGIAITSRAFLIRNDLVALPILCIGFGFGMELVHERVARLRGKVAIGAAWAGAFVLVPLWQAVRTQELVQDARWRAVHWIASHENRRASVACTREVDADATGYRPEVRDVLRKENVTIQNDVENIAQIDWAKPDYVLVVSHPDLFGRGDVWPFSTLPGYEAVAHFDANPYEHNFDITPTWMGRFSTLVLRRQ